MKYLVFLFLGILCFPFIATAQEAVVEISCKSLNPDYHDENDENDAEYVAGVDVDGEPVLSANVDNSPILYQEPIEIPIMADFIQLKDIEVLKGVNLESHATLAGLVIYPDGQVFYNGHDLTQAVKSKCAENPLGEEDSLIEIENLKQDGHNESDGLKSAEDIYK